MKCLTLSEFLTHNTSLQHTHIIIFGIHGLESLAAMRLIRSMSGDNKTLVIGPIAMWATVNCRRTEPGFMDLNRNLLPEKKHWHQTFLQRMISIGDSYYSTSIHPLKPFLIKILRLKNIKKITDIHSGLSTTDIMHSNDCKGKDACVI